MRTCFEITILTEVYSFNSDLTSAAIGSTKALAIRTTWSTNSVWQDGAFNTTEELRLIASYKVSLY